MREICVQVQPERAPRLDLEAVARVMLQISLKTDTRKFSVVRGPNHAWINFMFGATALRPVWSAVREVG